MPKRSIKEEETEAGRNVLSRRSTRQNPEAEFSARAETRSRSQPSSPSSKQSSLSDNKQEGEDSLSKELNETSAEETMTTEGIMNGEAQDLPLKDYPSNESNSNETEPNATETQSSVPSSTPLSPKPQQPTQAASKLSPRRTRSSRSTIMAPTATTTGLVAADANNNGPLDELTLDSVVQFLSTPSLYDDRFDEEDVLALMHRTNKIAEQRSKNYKALGDSGDIQADQDLFQKCLEQAQYETLADDLLQDLMRHLEEQDFKHADRRTVSWVKRSLGASLRKRPSSFAHLLKGDSMMHHRRYTRGMAQKKSKRRKKEKDVDLLHSAVVDLGKERGEPFRLQPRRSRDARKEEKTYDNKENATKRATSNRVVCVMWAGSLLLVFCSQLSTNLSHCCTTSPTANAKAKMTIALARKRKRRALLGETRTAPFRWSNSRHSVDDLATKTVRTRDFWQPTKHGPK